MMRTLKFVPAISALCLFCLPLPALSQAYTSKPSEAPRVDRHLNGLTAGEADALIEKLKEAQRKLRNGEKLYSFDLLSGAPASDPTTRVSPREVFLEMRFDKVFIIERGRTDNRLWQPYELAFKPEGPGQTSWQLEVVLDFYGNLERVEMIYKAPPPF